MLVVFVAEFGLLEEANIPHQLIEDVLRERKGEPRVVT